MCKYVWICKVVDMSNFNIFYVLDVMECKMIDMIEIVNINFNYY